LKTYFFVVAEKLHASRNSHRSHNETDNMSCCSSFMRVLRIIIHWRWSKFVLNHLSFSRRFGCSTRKLHLKSDLNQSKPFVDEFRTKTIPISWKCIAVTRNVSEIPVKFYLTSESKLKKKLTYENCLTKVYFSLLIRYTICFFNNNFVHDPNSIQRKLY